MNRLIALFYFVLSLAGFDVGGSSFEHRRSDNGEEVLLSRAYVQGGVARFDCVQSTSGECHYIVLPKDCGPGTGAASDAAACTMPDITRFSLLAGESHQVSGLQRFRLCVGPGSDAAGEDCQTALPGGGRDG